MRKRALLVIRIWKGGCEWKSWRVGFPDLMHSIVDVLSVFDVFQHNATKKAECLKVPDERAACALLSGPRVGQCFDALHVRRCFRLQHASTQCI